MANKPVKTTTTVDSSTPSPLDWLEARWQDWFNSFGESGIRLEEFDEKGAHVVRAEMPGMDPDKDVELTVDHGMLTIHAERREEKKSDEKDRYRSEFSYGAFTRSVRLPAGATEDDVKASYTDGILEVRFPVDDEKAAARKIPVARG